MFVVGTISNNIGNLYSLTSLNLHSNKLQGGIPNTIGCLTNLVQLDIDTNTINGTDCLALIVDFVLALKLYRYSSNNDWIVKFIGLFAFWGKLCYW